MENCFWILNEALDDFFFLLTPHACVLSHGRTRTSIHILEMYKVLAFNKSFVSKLSTDTDQNAKNKLWCLKGKNERTSSRWPMFVGGGKMLVSTIRCQIARTDNQICVCVHVYNLSAHVSFLLKMVKLLETFRHLFCEPSIRCIFSASPRLLQCNWRKRIYSECIHMCLRTKSILGGAVVFPRWRSRKTGNEVWTHNNWPLV